MKDALAFVLLRGLGLVARLLGRRGRVGVAAIAARLIVAAHHPRVSIAFDNLRASFPEWDAARCRETARLALHSLLVTFLELPWLATASRDVVAGALRIPNIEDLRRTASNGAIFLSAHFGNWELAALAGALHFERPFTVVVKEQRSVRVTAWLERLRTRFGNTLVPMRNVRTMLRTLEDRGMIALLADQSATQNDLFVEFFGRPAATYEAPAVFALRYRIPILFGLARREGPGKYVVEITRVPMDDLDGDTPDNVRTLTERHVRLLEREVRRCPEQWLWLHRRWKHV